MTVSATDIGLLYERECGRLRAHVRRLVKHPGSAEDLVQQAFANMLGRPENAEAHTLGYALRAVHNLALNHLRDARRRALVEVSGVDVHEIVDPAPTPEAMTVYRLTLRRILQAIAGLPARQRQAFVLKRIEGLSYDEVAARMGTSRNTVISQVVAALAALDARLG
ncbi:MAG: RNA polymerase sigma factor [Pseudomonas sp.]